MHMKGLVGVEAHFYGLYSERDIDDTGNVDPEADALTGLITEDLKLGVETLIKQTFQGHEVTYEIDDNEVPVPEVIINVKLPYNQIFQYRLVLIK
jgi:hypothetical protein